MLKEDVQLQLLRNEHLMNAHSLLGRLGQEEPIPPDFWEEDEEDDEDDEYGEHRGVRAVACMLASCRFIDQSESFALARANWFVLRRLPVPSPRPVFMLCGSELSHAHMPLNVRCGQDAFIVFRLISSVTGAPAPLRAHWAKIILSRLHRGHRSQMLETLAARNSVVYNGVAYKTLADHNPHSCMWMREYGKLRVLDAAWELCPDTCDARHVCASYPWAANTLVFADGCAHWTRQADLQHFERYYKKYGRPSGPAAELKPGGNVGGPNHLMRVGDRYGIPPEDKRDTDDLDDFWNDMMPDVLLRRRLPQ
jgi:hypothetical protein